MSSIPIVGKIFKKIDETPILKAVVIAAVIYFTASAASSYFSAQGATVAGAGGTMATTTVASASAASAAGAGAAAGSAGAAGAAGSAGLSAGTVSTTALNVSLPTAMTTSQMAAAEVTASTLGSNAAATSWFAQNPVATMMLGQGVSAASAADSAKEAAGKMADLKREEMAQRENARTERGLMGFNYDGSKGIINSQVSAPPPGIDQAGGQPEPVPAQATSVQRVAAPTVAAPQSQAPIIASQQNQAQPGTPPQQVAMKRSELPKLNRPQV